MKVYVTTGENGVVFVASSPEKAEDLLKKRYKPPYKVEWKKIKEGWVRGEFEDVQGYSSEHYEDFDIQEYEMDET